VTQEQKRIATLAVHAAERSVEGAVSFPTFQTSMFRFSSETDYNDIRYVRHNNTPNQNLVGQKVAALEKAEAGLAFASGMGAISTTLLTLLGCGDHLIAHNSLYGGSMDFVRSDLREFNIHATFVDACDPHGWSDALRPQTRVFFVEAIANPLTSVADFDAIVAFARKHRLITVIDSTFATPINFRPLEAGFDVVLHSASKYLGGHSDLVAGVVVGRKELVNRIKLRSNHLGACLDPQACHVLHRSLKTLAIRMERHNANALAIARHLTSHSEVTRVHYPGLASHPQHATARRHFAGFGGVLSIEMRGGDKVAAAVVQSTKLFVHAGSLGGVESLICRPSATSHLALSEDAQRAAGINPALIRISVGIEDQVDLIQDLDQAIESSSVA
jgi:cystathionine beta-lyase/cystathionine gamma-synthase